MNEAGCRCRIVFDHNRLREKELIFHDDLDDRAIETLKLMVEAMASESAHDRQDEITPLQQALLGIFSQFPR